MALICEECKKDINSSPVRFVARVKQDLKTGRRTVSDMEIAICRSHFSKLKGRLQTDPPMMPDKDMFVVAERTGGFSAIQLDDGPKPAERFSFAQSTVVRMILPRAYIRFEEEAARYIDWEDFLKKCSGKYSEPDKENAFKISKEFGIPYASFENKILKMEKGQELEKLVPAAYAREHCVLPLFLDDTVLAMAMANPEDVVLLDNLKLSTGGLDIQPFVACRSQILKAIDKFYVR
jgi:hypothetical protein